MSPLPGACCQCELRGRSHSASGSAVPGKPTRSQVTSSVMTAIPPGPSLTWTVQWWSGVGVGGRGLWRLRRSLWRQSARRVHGEKLRPHAPARGCGRRDVDMSASLVRATVRAVSKRKLQPTRAALTLVSPLGVRGEVAAARGTEQAWTRTGAPGGPRAELGGADGLWALPPGGRGRGRRFAAEVTAFREKGHVGNAAARHNLPRGVSPGGKAGLGCGQRETGKSSAPSRVLRGALANN